MDSRKKLSALCVIVLCGAFLLGVSLSGCKSEKPDTGHKQEQASSTSQESSDSAKNISPKARAELRAFYLGFESFVKSGDIQKKNWLYGQKRKAWLEPLNKLRGFRDPESGVTPNVTSTEAGMAEKIFYLSNALYDNAGRFDGIMEDDLKTIVNAIKTGPADDIGAYALRQAAKDAATATPEEKARVQKAREMRQKIQQRKQDEPRLVAAIKKLDKDITDVTIIYDNDNSDRRAISITYMQDLASKPFYAIGHKAIGLLQQMQREGFVGEETEVKCYPSVPAQEQYSNEGRESVIWLAWDGATLSKINWENTSPSQLLNLCSRVEVQPLIRKEFTEFAADVDNQKEYAEFIKKALDDLEQESAYYKKIAERVFPFTTDEFVTRLTTFYRKLDTPLNYRREGPSLEAAGEMAATTVTIDKYFSLVIIERTDSHRVKRVIFTGAGDGSENAEDNIILNSTLAAAAVINPEMPEDELRQLASEMRRGTKGLGGFSYPGVDISTEMKEGVGFVVTMSPL